MTLPASVENLSGLLQLNLGACSALDDLPSGLTKLSQLSFLSLASCSSLLKLPPGLRGMPGLELDLAGCSELELEPPIITFGLPGSPSDGRRGSGDVAARAPAATGRNTTGGRGAGAARAAGEGAEAAGGHGGGAALVGASCWLRQQSLWLMRPRLTGVCRAEGPWLGKVPSWPPWEL